MLQITHSIVGSWQQVIRYQAVTVTQTQYSGKVRLVIILVSEQQLCKGPPETFINNYRKIRNGELSPCGI